MIVFLLPLAFGLVQDHGAADQGEINSCNPLAAICADLKWHLERRQLLPRTRCAATCCFHPITGEIPRFCQNVVSTCPVLLHGSLCYGNCDSIIGIRATCNLRKKSAMESRRTLTRPADISLWSRQGRVAASFRAPAAPLRARGRLPGTTARSCSNYSADLGMD